MGDVLRRRWVPTLVLLCISAVLVMAIVRPADAKTYQRGAYSFDLAPAPAWVSVHAIPATWPESAPGAHEERWREWLYDTQVDRRDGTHTRYRDMAYEAMSSELIGDAGKFQIDFNPDFQKLIIHRFELRRNGQWQSRLNVDAITRARRETQFEQDISTGEVTALIVLPDVRTNDVVRIAYSLVGSNPVLAGMDSEDANSTWYFPMLDRHFRVLFDPGASPAFHLPAGAQPPRLLHLPDRVEANIDAHGVAAIHDEGGYPKWYSATGEMIATEHRDWPAVAAWARALYPKPKPLPPDMEVRVATWKKLPTQDQRIGAALRAVQEEVRYFGDELGLSTHRPAEPSETWNRRFGDCKDKARLLAAILNELGITAYPAMVSARRGKAVADDPPNAGAFDHVIVQVKLPDTTLWLDPTVTGQRGPVRSLSRAPFGVALVVAPGTHGLTTMERAPEAHDRMVVSEHYVPDERDNGVTLDIQNRFEGEVAEFQRRRIQSEDPHATQRRYADYYRSRFGKVDGAPPVISDDPQTGILSISEHYQLASPWVQTAGNQRSIDLREDSIGNTTQTPTVAQRTAPYALTYPLEITHTIRITLPAGWQWANVPDKKTWGDAALHFDESAESRGQDVTVAAHYRSLAETVPAEDFPIHYELMRKINDAINQRLAFEIKVPDADKQRDVRLQNLMRGLMDDRQPEKH